MTWLRRLAMMLVMATGTSAVAGDSDELEQLLHAFLANTVDDDLTNHDRFWSEELIYTSASGTRFGKDAILQSIRDAADAPAPQTLEPAYTAEEIDVRMYGRMAIVAFTLVATWVEDTEEQTQRYFNTGTFRKRKGQWRVVAWHTNVHRRHPSLLPHTMNLSGAGAATKLPETPAMP